MNEVKPKVAVSVFQMLDALDDGAILTEMEGRLTKNWVYAFKQGGTMIYGLGKEGVDQACLILAQKGCIIRETGVKYSVDPTNPAYVLFEATVQKFGVTRDGKEIPMEIVIGHKRQCTKILLRTGGAMPDPHWFEKGAGKALRNARMRLIPENIKSQIIAKAKKIGNVKDTGVDVPEEAPPIQAEVAPAEVEVPVMAEASAVQETAAPSNEQPAEQPASGRGKPRKAKIADCSNCGGAITAQAVVDYSQKKYGKVLCFSCQKHANSGEI
jgi:hypothetical protein